MEFSTFMEDADALKSAIEQRHSVRQYTDAPLSEEDVSKLRSAIDSINEDCWTDIQLIQDEPRAFNGFLARYGKFSGVRNYLALVGPECKELQEILGHEAEKLVLYAQALGLNTCWVGGTFKVVNRAYRVEIGCKLEAVIVIGHGESDGKPSKSVSPDRISKQYPNGPEWFKRGVDSALLAPTALNQQKFRFDLSGEDAEGNPLVKAHSKRGPFSKMDLGIAKLHFEIGAGASSFEWA